MVLQDLDNVALAVAMLFGLFYSLNMSYPSQLSYTFRLIQRVVMELDAARLLRKAQNLKDKTATISHLFSCILETQFPGTNHSIHCCALCNCHKPIFPFSLCKCSLIGSIFQFLFVFFFFKQVKRCRVVQSK